ncbi:MAG: serine/threonine-protein phosphatase, partial [Melioribacteraceae bacterium]|nr:serine/threonine-protein phosphatase [Melioribacteraceae bacterium]
FRKKKNIVEEIELKGMPLGAMENFPYQVKDASVESGDTILLMSDGLPELPNGTNEMYGYDRIMNEFNSAGNKAPEEIIDHLKKTAAKWINGNDPDDDITFVVIKVK